MNNLKQASENQVLNTMMSHRSIRNYTDKDINTEDLNKIIQASQAAPSWHNGQHVSIIIVKNKETRKKLAVLSGNQKWIEQAPVFFVFCADFHRIKLACEIEEKEFKAAQNIDLLLVGSTDVGIYLANAITAAESLGLGTVPIGGIRRNPLEVIELLQLPQYVIPISGLCIGYPSTVQGLKPRFPQQAIVHEEVYNAEAIDQINDYNQIYSQYMYDRTNGESDSNWTQRMAEFYSESFYRNNSYAHVRKMLIQQGFAIEN